MGHDGRHSRKLTATRRVLGLFATFIVGAIAVGWLTKGSAAQGSGQWMPQSPAPFLVSGTAVATPDTFRTHNSGRVSAIAVDPRDPSRWLVGVGNGGVWETRDNGGRWTPISDDAPTLAMGAIAFAPSNPDIVYAATGETVWGNAFVHGGVGLLKSVNGGAWTVLGQASLARGGVRRVRVDPNDPNVLVLALSRSGFGRDSTGLPPALAPAFGVLRSTDGGATWTRTLPGVPSALEVDPGNFSRQYAAISVGAQPNGIFRSTNGGVSWSRIDGPWWPNPFEPDVAVGRIELAIAPSNPDVLYAGIATAPLSANRGELLGLFRTDNAWANPPTWIRVPTEATGPGGYCAEVAEERKCEYSHVISVDPRNADRLFAGGGRNLWRCTNCGTSPTWTNLTSDRRSVFVHVDFHVLEWAGNRLITGNDGGVFSTTDFGATWQDHNRTLTTIKFYAGALHPTDPVFLLGGARDFGLAGFRAATGWRVFQPTSGSLGGEGGDVAISSSRPDTDWMCLEPNLQGIYRTTDGGQTGARNDAGIDRTGAAFIAPVRKCPANDDVFLAGSVRVWRTNNFFSGRPTSWTANSPPREAPTDPGVIHAITFVDEDRSCNTYAYGTRGGEVRFTRDGGTSWIDLDPAKGLPARPINSLAFDPSNTNRLFAAVSSYDIVTPRTPGHIFRTDNALSSSPTWTRVGPPDLPFADMPFNVIKIDPRDPRIVYAGSDNGLWQSVDGGTTFSKVGLESGLPPAAVNDIQINPATNRTVIFTYGRGAFELAR